VDQINYLLMDRRAGVMEWFDRMVAYGQVVKPILNEEKVPEDMFYLAAILSDLDPNARPKAGGVGWWALGAVKEKKAPADIQWVATNEWDDRRDPAISTRVACNLFQWLHRRRQTKDWLLTICAFIEGADKIDAAAAKTPGFSYWDVVMPPRCDVIVPRLVALKIIDSNRELYGVAVAPTAPMEYDSLDRLKLLKELPLHVAARWCRTSPRSMWELNPGVDPASGFLPKPDKRSPAGYPFRAPKGMGNKVRQLLIKEGYLAG
jgi:membrane-bound lytic murein transglycosylase D